MNDIRKTTTDRWYVYMVRCQDQSLYTGITSDLDRRVQEHNGKGSNGARYTRPRRPVTLVYAESVNSRSLASQRELVIKALRKAEKETLAHSFVVAPPPDIPVTR